VRGQPDVDEGVATDLLGAAAPGRPLGDDRHQYCLRRRVRSRRTMAGSSNGKRKSEIAAPRPSAPPRMPVLYASVGRISVALSGPPFVSRYTMLRSDSVKTVSNAVPMKRIGAIIGTMIMRKRCMKLAP